MKKTVVFGKTILLIIISTLTLYYPQPVFLTGLFLLSSAAFLFFPDRQLIFYRLRPLLIVGILVILFQLFFNRTVPISDRLLLGYVAAIRLLIISLLVLIYTTITSFSDLILLFDFFPRSVQLLLAMTFYLIPSILREAEEIQMVQKARGMRNNPVAVTIPLLHRVFARAETLSYSIISRGYEE